MRPLSMFVRFSVFIAFLAFLLALPFCQQQLVDGVSHDATIEPGQDGPVTLAILPFSSEENSAELQRFSLGLTSLTRSYLIGYEKLQVIDPLGIHLSLDQEKYLQRVRQLGARFILTGKLARENGRYSIVVELRDLRSNRSATSDEIIAPASVLGTLPYDITLRMDELALEMDLRNGDSPWISRRERDQSDRRFKPSIDAFQDFSQGAYRELFSAGQAIHYYNRALSIEPYFREARDRVFRLQNLSNAQRAAGFRQTTSHALVLMRRNQVDPMVVALTYQDFGRKALSRDRTLASKWFQESNRWLYLEGRYKSSYYADNQNTIGSVYLYQFKANEAYTRFQSAYQLQRDLGLDQSLSGLESHMNLACVYAMRKEHPKSLQHLAAAQRLARDLNPGPAILAIMHYNEGVIHYSRGIYPRAIESSRKARDFLIEANMANSPLHLSVLLNINASLLYQRRYDDALRISDAIAVRARSIGETNYPPYRYALHNTAFALQKLGRSLEAAQALRLANYSGYGPGRPLYETFLSIHEVPEGSTLFNTSSEESQVASYTGAFNMQYHQQSVRSRTYPGRQDDTNILLRDILYPRKKDPGLQYLRDHWLEGKSDLEGDGILFIDVGPGLANVRWPAVTTQSMARDFRRMDVVALDLPEQVRLFQTQVPSYKKNELLAHSNLRIVGADGRDSLITVFSDAKRWPIRDRGPVELQSGRPVMIRMANSIDIYLKWYEMEDVLHQLAEDLEDNPLLICFNRSILLKKAGSTDFEVVGYVSIRGFHHNLELLDRGGEPPYTLIDNSSLSFLD
ncbi:MAG: hypothetical protein RH862_05595 [Leptospiraceae bacterium]